jgi:uncharacterized protein
MTVSGENLDPRIAEMVERIVQVARPDQVILFGSRATGMARPLLVVMPLSKPRRRLEGDLNAAVAHSELSKDIVVVTPEELERYRHTSGTIISPALQTGLVVYRRAA